jgi:phosphoribosylanthranilate isomerase
MFRIKICGIRNVNDAQAAARAGADAIGLNFFKKSRRFVEPLVAREIVAALPDGVTKVGVFVNHDTAEIAEIVDRVKLDSVQLHGDESPEVLSALPISVRIIRAFRCGTLGLSTLAHYLGECKSQGRIPDAVLVDADAGADFGGTGRLTDWTSVANERHTLAGVPIILAGGLTPDNVAAAIAAVRPDGVDVASGVENETAHKDHDLIARFVDSARQAFASNAPCNAP